MKRFNVWKGTASQDERGGSETLVGYYLHRSDALEDVKGQGFWGSDGRVQSLGIDVIEVEVGNGETMIFPLESAIKVFSKRREQREAEQTALRESARAKLTKEELIALGLAK